MLIACVLKNKPTGSESLLRKCLRPFYDWKTRKETIFAPATSIQDDQGSPLGIIRLSGTRTKNVIESITRLKVINPNENSYSRESDKQVLKPRYAKLAKIFDPSERDSTPGELVDVGLLLWFPRPHSYTGEDVCELHVHGSRAIFNRLLSMLGKIEGLRPAEPGEFTLRAVQNKKMDLLQAESLSELISSTTDQQRKLALKGLTGAVRTKYETWIDNLVSILAHLEASIDFGEDELLGEQKVVGECLQKLRDLTAEIGTFVRISSQCRDLMQNGARVAILGRPNAGKSTFMNILCGREKSIVSDLSGTTRDVIEHSFELAGHRVSLCDTAGLKDLNSPVATTQESSPIGSVIGRHNTIEQEGVRRALSEANKAHLLIYIVDGSEFNARDHVDDIVDQLGSMLLVNLDEEATNKCPKALHLVINKIDLTNEHICDDVAYRERLGKLIKMRLSSEKLSIDHVATTLISCRTQKNLDILIQRISSSLSKLQSANRRESEDERANDSIELDYVNERHLSLLRSVQRHLQLATKLELETIDEMAQHVRESIDYLSRIVGSVQNEQVLDVIFRDFCIGK